jgi:hypothetical protein
LALLGSAALMATIFAQPANAHPRHAKKKHRHDRVVYVPRHAHDHVRVQRVFRVPQQIHRRVRAQYRPYYEGAVWYRPHRHAHTVYHFPVLTPNGYVYRPHEYCQGGLYTGGYVAYNSPRVSFRIGF